MAEIDWGSLIISVISLVPINFIVKRFLQNYPELYLPKTGAASFPDNVNQDIWRQLFKYDGIEQLKGAGFLGKLETILYLIALIVNAEVLIAGWLTFKVATKWETWNNVIKVPSTFPDYEETNTSIDFLRIRLIWGVRTMDRFLIGTLLNLLGAIAAFTVYTASQQGNWPSIIVEALCTNFA